MVDFGNVSDTESLDSDEELQLAFSRGELKGGLHVEAAAPKQIINNVSGLKQKLEEFKQNLDWIERMDLSNAPAPAPRGTEMIEETNTADSVHDDFKRELIFYRQAQATVLQGVSKLHHLGVKTKRPEDYFAEMAKTDDHMKKVREKLLEKKTNMEQREKARKLRDLRKYGKKVQQEVLQKRQKEKREMLDAVKKFRKGQKEKLDFLDDDEKKQMGARAKDKHSKDKPHFANKKRQYKNSKYGHGGQKKRSKLNTADSARDMSDFSSKVHQSKPGFNKKKTRNVMSVEQLVTLAAECLNICLDTGKGKLQRPGKSKRMKIKNKRR